MDYTLEGNTLTVGNQSIEIATNMEVDDLATWLQARGVDPQLASDILVRVREGYTSNVLNRPVDAPLEGSEEDALEGGSIWDWAKRIFAGEEVSEEVRQAVSEEVGGPSEMLRLMEYQAGGGAQPWIMSRDGGLAGNYEDIDWNVMFQMAVEMFPELAASFGSGRIDGETDDEFHQRKMETWLSFGPDETKQFFLHAYGSDPTTPLEWRPDMKVDGHSYYDLNDWANQYQMRPEDVLDWANYAKATGVDVGVLITAATAAGLELKPNQYRADELYKLGPAAPPEPEPEEPYSGGDRFTSEDLMPTPEVPGRGMRRHGRARSSQKQTLRSSTSLYQFGQKLSEGIDKYDSTVLGIVYATDPMLAERMYASWYELEAEDLTRIQEILGNDWEALQELNGVRDIEVAWLRQVTEGGGINFKYDSAAVTEAARTIIGSWNLNLGEAGIESLVAGWKDAQLAVIQSQSPWLQRDAMNSVDSPDSPDPYFREQLRGTAEYSRLFGHMQAGETEEEYVNRFETQSQNLLGDRMIEHVRTGMMAGDPSAVVGSAIASGDAYKSSRFRERMFSAADVFRSMT